MLRLRSYLLRATLIASFLVVPFAVPGTARAVTPCDTSRDLTYDKWQPSNNEVYGVEAPITITTDASLCSYSGSGNTSNNSLWVAINSIPTGSISQIGFLAVYDPMGGGVTYCRFIGTGSGLSTTYGACAVTNDYERYFKVHVITVGGVEVYGLMDCDTGYTNCTEENTGTLDSKYSESFGWIASEVSRSKDCRSVETGSSNDHVNFGDLSASPSQPIQFQTSEQGAWNTETDSQNYATCGDYMGNLSSTHMGTWDSRN